MDTEKQPQYEPHYALINLMNQLETMPWKFLREPKLITSSTQDAITVDVPLSSDTFYHTLEEPIFATACRKLHMPYLRAKTKLNEPAVLDILPSETEYNGSSLSPTGKLDIHATKKNYALRRALNKDSPKQIITADKRYIMFEDKKLQSPKDKATVFFIADRRNDFQDVDEGLRVFFATYYVRYLQQIYPKLNVMFINYNANAGISSNTQRLIQKTDTRNLQPSRAYALLKDILELQMPPNPHILHYTGGTGNTEVAKFCAEEIREVSSQVKSIGYIEQQFKDTQGQYLLGQGIKNHFTRTSYNNPKITIEHIHTIMDAQQAFINTLTPIHIC